MLTLSRKRRRRRERRRGKEKKRRKEQDRVEKCPEKFPPRKTRGDAIGKRYKPNSAQRLIDPGPLLPIVAVAIPRMHPVTYLDLNSQLGAEQEHATMLHLEEHARCMLHVNYYAEMMHLAGGGSFTSPG